MSLINVGSVAVDIVPSAKGFQQKLDAAIRDARVEVKAVLDDSGIRAQIDQLTRNATTSIRADLDDAAAAAKLGELSRDRSTTVNVDLDDGDASAKLDALTRARKATVNVDADTGAASAQMDGFGGQTDHTRTRIVALIAAIAGIGPATVPVAAAAAGAIAGIGSAALVGAAGIGVLAIGLKGVVSAVAATTKAQSQSAATAAANAAAQQAAAQKITSAQEALRSAQDGLKSSQQGLTSAQAGLANAQANAADAAIRAAEAVKNAQSGVRQATQEAASGVTSALQQEATAERSLQDALQRETDAQKALSDARKQAKQDLDDLNNSVTDGALAQRQAAIDVENARIALQKLGPTQTQIETAVAATAAAQAKYAKLMADPKATAVQQQSAKAALDAAAAQQKLLQQTAGGSDIQRQQAQLDYDQAVQHQKELAQQQQRLTTQQKTAKKQGVEGSDVVQTAKSNLAGAKQNVGDAQQGVKQAQDAVTQARLDGTAKIAKAEQALADAEREQASQQRQSAYSVAQAQQQVVNAHNSIQQAERRVADSQKSLQDAYSKTGAAASSSTQAAADAMAKLTPQGRALANLLTKSIIPGFQQLSNVAQGPIAGGALKGLQAAQPIVKPLTKLVKALAGAMGDLLESAGQALGSPFWTNFVKNLIPLVGPTIKQFGSIVGNVARGLGGIVTAFAPFGQQIGKALGGLAKSFADFGTGKTGALQDFLAYVEKIGPSVVGTFGSLFKLAGKLLVALAPVGKVALDVIKQVADGFNKMSTKGFGDIFQKTLIPALKLVGTLLTTVFFPLLNAASPLLTIFKEVVGAVVDGLKKNAPQLQQVFKQVFTILQQLQPIITALLPLIGNAITTIVSVLNGALKVISGILDILTGIFTGNFTQIKKGAKEIFDGLKGIVVAVLKSIIKQANVFAGPLAKAFNLAWGGIKAIFTAVKNWVVNTWSKVWNKAKSIIMTPINGAKDALTTLFGSKGPIRATFNAIKDWVTGTWSRVWNAVKSAVMTPLNDAKSALSALFGSKGPIRSAFNGVKDWVINTWSRLWAGLKYEFTHPIQAAKNAIAVLLGKTGLQSVFSDAVSKIGSIWNGLQALAKKPINFIVSTVLNDGLIKAFNSVASFFGFGGKGGAIKPIPWPPKGWARGGVLPGFTPVHRGDDMLAPMRSGEGVAVSEAMRDPYERRRLLALNHAALTGGTSAIRRFRESDGYAIGGIVRPINAKITQGIHDQYTGFPAVDAAAPVGTPVVAGADGRVVKSYDIRGYEPRKVGPQDGFRSYGRVIQIASKGFQTLYAHLSQRMAQVGQTVKAGQEIGLSGNTGNTTGPHLHFGAQGISPLDFWQSRFGKIIGAIGGAIGGALKSIDPLSVLQNALSSGISGLKKVAGSPFGQMTVAGVGWLKNHVVDWAKGKLGSLVGLGPGSSAAVGPAQAYAKSQMSKYGWGADQWPALQKLWQGESGWSDTIVNSSSGAGGIPQAYPPSKMGAGWFGNYVKQINWGEPYIKQVYGTPENAYAKWLGRDPHWYDNGGFLQPGTTIVHNGTGKPEPVFTGGQWDRIDALLNRSATPPISIDVHDNDIKDEGKLVKTVLTRLGDQIAMAGLGVGS